MEGAEASEESLKRARPVESEVVQFCLSKQVRCLGWRVGSGTDDELMTLVLSSLAEWDNFNILIEPNRSIVAEGANGTAIIVWVDTQRINVRRVAGATFEFHSFYRKLAESVTARLSEHGFKLIQSPVNRHRTIAPDFGVHPPAVKPSVSHSRKVPHQPGQGCLQMPSCAAQPAHLSMGA